jgi:hypothetical protein
MQLTNAGAYLAAILERPANHICIRSLEPEGMSWRLMLGLKSML